MVYRVCVEKKPGLAPECASLLSDCRSFLDLKSLENVRIWNRYDVEGIDEACETVPFQTMVPLIFLSLFRFVVMVPLFVKKCAFSG